MYYGQPAGSALSSVEGSRPSSARPTTPNSNPIHRLTTAATRPRTRTNETGQSIRWMSKPDPRDPRSHWVKALRLQRDPDTFAINCDTAGLRICTPIDVMFAPGGVHGGLRLWIPEQSLFSDAETFKYGPFAWDSYSHLEDTEPGREKTLQMRVLDLERKRYENARWWRNLNRWMIPLGLVIITIVITLAVVGTKVGF
ncbi:serine-rich protein [Aspergillus nomiae NRRL 13137]|uniref:Serine-rich protein n=1 Tax=Aspergillus nomiae NRRL (strain ATCC 15546 / NRRL 13137 / CBS 260.88 / M93) TaxID=1509407 RepID=A0A0L1IP99_ASPN3|nr:serine-rich protein [Aspergillus nomiae NRRL 13137]KNG81329.1 serine-rich protein [Aspergillus nomiae NRRL 13137]